MSFMNAFDDWEYYTCQLQRYSSTQDTSGNVINAWTNLGAPFKAAKWIDSTEVTNVNDKYVNQELGTIAINADTYTVAAKKNDKVVISGVDYYVVGIDSDVMGFGDLTLLSYRREYGQ